MDIFFDHLRAKWYWFAGSVTFCQVVVCFSLLFVLCFFSVAVCKRNYLFSLSEDKSRIYRIIKRLVFVSLAPIALGCALTLIVTFTVLGRDSSAVNSGISAFSSFVSLLNGNYSILFDQLFNVLLFVPLGLVVRFIWPFRITLLLSLIISIMVEAVQLLTCRGLFELSDILTNTIGALIGIGMSSMIIKIFGIIRKSRKGGRVERVQ